MEFFFPLLALALLYGLSWLASLYLLVQFILGVRMRRGLVSWSILWLSVWPFFVLGVAVDCITGGRRYTPLNLIGSFCTFFIPLLWLVALGLFRKSAAAEKRKAAEAQAELERQYILDVRPRDDIWPPPPAR